MKVNLKDVLVVAGSLLVGGVAVAGWSRHQTPAPARTAATYTQPVQPDVAQPGMNDAAYPNPNTVAAPCDPNGAPASYQTANYAPGQGRYITDRQPVRVLRRQPEAGTYASAPVHRVRSTKKSLAIVGGTAAGGAAIGALADGGKGAAIGALSGGAAGFVYDRLTHNR